MYTKRHPFTVRRQDDQLDLMEHDTYKNSISDPTIPPPPRGQPDTLHSEYVLVSSDTRDRSRDPNPADFLFKFDRKNVHRVELVSGFLPTITPAVPFLYLDIENMRHVETPKGNVFHVLTLKEARGFTEVDTGACSSAFQPLQDVKLQDARVRLLSPDAMTVIDLANEGPNATLDQTKQVKFLLRITRRVPKPLCCI